MRRGMALANAVAAWCICSSAWTSILACRSSVFWLLSPRCHDWYSETSSPHCSSPALV